MNITTVYIVSVDTIWTEKENKGIYDSQYKADQKKAALQEEGFEVDEIQIEKWNIE